ncbi:MAG: cadherin repeat domain-containing protein, partial [Rhodobiaceae bacterium]|nr:cadherin repeat domain-containing protein [Rhodobiaceae bacterium]
DHLFGGSGADTFVVGEWNANFYADTSPNFSNHYAVIEDFNPFAGDKVQFTGALSNYTEVIVNGVDKEILLNGDLIAYIKGGIFFDMARDGVSAPFLPIFLPFAATQTSSLAAVAPEEPSAEPAGASPIMALASAGAFTVEAESDPALLLQKLGQPAGFSNTSLTIDGNAQAVGWFADDPFGLGGGIVISTGRVEDLPGANTDAGASPATLRELPLDFVKIGTVNNSTVYKATLTGLDIDMQSITLNDSNLRTEGGDGQVSGFDLNSIMLSTVDIPVGGSLAGINTMSRLNVFDFSAAGTHYRAGDQRFDPLDSFNDAAPYLRGSLTDSLINNARATLQTLDVYDSFQNGFVSLGDGGSIGFDLTTPVSTNGPLYLYVSEADASTGETLTGVISASTEQVEPAGDLSTDLGDRGLGGDTTTLTYHFTPDAKSATVQFQVVLFSEELPEFAGAAPFDVLSATLNGVSIGTLSDGKAATLDNLMVTTYGPKHPDLILNTPVTGPAADLIRADAYTTVLTFTGRADVGVDNVLKLEVADKGDAFLDTGIMIRALTLTGAPIPGAITVTASGEVVENGADATITVTRPDDADTDSTVTVHLTPSGNLELGEGGGAGEGVDVVFEPGESGSKDVSVKAVSNDGPSLPAHVDATVTSDDPDFTNPAIPRIGFDIVDTYMVPENTLDVTDLSVPGIPDGTSLAWSVTGGADAAQFEIDPATAKLSFVTAPDFENPSDTGADNAYDLVVTARNGAGAVVDEQTLNVVVTDVSETSVLRVTFESESSNYKNTLGWYDSRTGEGGILFASVDSHGRCHLNPGDTVAFEVDSTADPVIGFFRIANGGGLRQNSESELSGAIKVIQLSN